MKLRYSDENKIFNIHTDGIPFLSFSLLDSLGVPNLYSTRYGSYDEIQGKGIEGLRLAVMKTDDINEAAPVVIKNRNLLARQLSSSIAKECITCQEHTADVYVVTPDDIGSVCSKNPAQRRISDGYVTDIPEVLLSAFGGDCPPVYLVDPVKKAIGLVHSGWRGTLKKISYNAISIMQDRFGSDPTAMYAAIGPGICRDCYEMGDEVYDVFFKGWSEKDADRILKRYPEGKYHLDLFEAILITLTNAGIQRDHIAVSNVCTKCNVDHFYSYRAGRMENEQVAMIVNRFH